jgi:hypothetical protein
MQTPRRLTRVCPCRLQQMNIFAKYLLNQGDAADGKHNPIVDWIWWAWNENSGDTGGIVSKTLNPNPKPVFVRQPNILVTQHSDALLRCEGAAPLMLSVHYLTVNKHASRLVSAASMKAVEAVC